MGWQPKECRVVKPISFYVPELIISGTGDYSEGGFYKNNIMYMSNPMCEEAGYDNATVDARLFLEKNDAHSKE